MKRDIVLRPGARSDLVNIWDFTHAGWGVEQAEAYFGKLNAALDRLAHQPALGSDRSHVRKGLRKLTVGAHAIFYFHDSKILRVSRILHVRMDVSTKSLS